MKQFTLVQNKKVLKRKSCQNWCQPKLNYVIVVLFISYRFISKKPIEYYSMKKPKNIIIIITVIIIIGHRSMQEKLKGGKTMRNSALYIF